MGKRHSLEQARLEEIQTKAMHDKIVLVERSWQEQVGKLRKKLEQEQRDKRSARSESEKLQIQVADLQKSLNCSKKKIKPCQVSEGCQTWNPHFSTIATQA